MFPVRQLLGLTARLGARARCMSGKAGSLVDLAVDDDGIATLTMQRAPVNSLNLDLLREMSAALDTVAKDRATGMVLTSASPTVFSAGLDIMEMYKPDLKRAEEFWNTLQEVWLKLFGSKFVTAAAINGHAPAGGCLLAMSCEYRAMAAGRYTIGLNETALGIVAPPWFIDTMTHTIPVRHAELALTSAKLFTVDEALKVGLIDEAASDKDDAVNKCKQFIKRFERVIPAARALTKLSVREAPLARLVSNRQRDTATFLGFLQDHRVQMALGVYIENLKKKAAAK